MKLADLTNGVAIARVHTRATSRCAAERSPLALCDEICFWRADDSRNPAGEAIYRALRPALSTIPNAPLDLREQHLHSMGTALPTIRIRGTSARTQVRSWCGRPIR